MCLHHTLIAYSIKADGYETQMSAIPQLISRLHTRLEWVNKLFVNFEFCFASSLTIKSQPNHKLIHQQKKSNRRMIMFILLESYKLEDESW